MAELPDNPCESLGCDNQSTQVVNCGCYPESHGWKYALCGECAEWIKGRITCPFHGDVDA